MQNIPRNMGHRSRNCSLRMFKSEILQEQRNITSHIPEMHLQLDKAWSERSMVRGKVGQNVKNENYNLLVTGAVRLWLLADCVLALTP